MFLQQLQQLRTKGSSQVTESDLLMFLSTLALRLGEFYVKLLRVLQQQHITTNKFTMTFLKSLHRSKLADGEKHGRL